MVAFDRESASVVSYMQSHMKLGALYSYTIKHEQSAHTRHLLLLPGIVIPSSFTFSTHTIRWLYYLFKSTVNDNRDKPNDTENVPIVWIVAFKPNLKMCLFF